MVIKSLDRLGRNYEQMKDEWKDLSDRGIKIKVLDTPLLDTSKYDDELMGKFVSDVIFSVLSYVADNEKEENYPLLKDIYCNELDGILWF